LGLASRSATKGPNDPADKRRTKANYC